MENPKFHFIFRISVNNKRRSVKRNFISTRNCTFDAAHIGSVRKRNQFNLFRFGWSLMPFSFAETIVDSRHGERPTERLSRQSTRFAVNETNKRWKMEEKETKKKSIRLSTNANSNFCLECKLMINDQRKTTPKISGDDISSSVSSTSFRSAAFLCLNFSNWEIERIWKILPQNQMIYQKTIDNNNVVHRLVMSQHKSRNHLILSSIENWVSAPINDYILYSPCSATD